jgi:hypothetical protein
MSDPYRDQETLQKLLEPFHSDAHHFREGRKKQVFTYIKEGPLTHRLDQVASGHWNFSLKDWAPDYKSVTGILVILGVTRENAGEADLEEEPRKSAATDALKRACRLHGIGRYLLYLPTGMDERRLTAPVIEQAACKAGWDGVRRLMGGSVPETSGDRAALEARDAPLDQARPSTPVVQNVALVCSDAACRRTLTKGQHDVSVRTFGKPLCPGCQKQAIRLAA